MEKEELKKEIMRLVESPNIVLGKDIIKVLSGHMPMVILALHTCSTLTDIRKAVSELMDEGRLELTDGTVNDSDREFIYYRIKRK